MTRPLTRLLQAVSQAVLVTSLLGVTTSLGLTRLLLNRLLVTSVLLLTRLLVTNALGQPRLPLTRLFQAVSLAVLVTSLLRLTPLLGLTRWCVSLTLLFLVEVLFFWHQSTLYKVYILYKVTKTTH